MSTVDMRHDRAYRRGMKTITYRGELLTNVGLSWYDAAGRHLGTTIAAAKAAILYRAAKAAIRGRQ